MNYEYIQDAVDCINRINCIDKREIRGCNFEEIETLRDLLDPHPLPLAYEEFLEFGGHGIADLLQTSNFYYNDVSAHRKQKKVEALYKQGNFFHPEFNSKLNINNRLFLSYYHQGYFIRVFYLTYFDENPKMLSYEAGSIYTSFVVSNMTFSEYLLAECQQYEKELNQLFNRLSPNLQNKFITYKKTLWDLIEGLEKLLLHYPSDINERIYATYLNNTAIINQALVPITTNRLDAIKKNLGEQFDQANLDEISIKNMITKMNQLEQLGQDLLSGK